MYAQDTQERLQVRLFMIILYIYMIYMIIFEGDMKREQAGAFQIAG